MMRMSEFKDYLQSQFPLIKFYNGAINKTELQCVGIYAKGTASPHLALGGKANSSFGNLPATLLIHWTENSDTCEQTANSLYEHLLGLSKITLGGGTVVSIQLLDSCPVDVGRDDNNIAERVIRFNIVYEREVM